VKQKNYNHFKWDLSIFTTILPYTSKIDSIFEKFKENENMSFFEFLDSLNFDENMYILSLRRKLTKPHIF
jgi:hypothetical protein